MKTMKTISTAAIAALMTAALGFSAIAPAMAQDAPPEQATAEQGRKMERGFGPAAHGPRHGMGGDLLNFERGAEGIEVALVRLSHRLDLTEAQKDLLETLKTDALAAAETLKAATEGLRPAPAAEGEAPAAISLADRLENRITRDTARLDALKSVQPALTAFFDSLTDEQKADLMPQRGERAGHAQPGAREAGPGPRHGGPAAPQNR
jgi:hypothetical protein